MSDRRVCGFEISLWDGGRYTDTRKYSHIVQEANPQHVADVLRSLARDVERRYGLRDRQEET